MKKQVHLIVNRTIECPFYYNGGCTDFRRDNRNCGELVAPGVPFPEPPSDCLLDDYNIENNPNLVSRT